MLQSPRSLPLRKWRNWQTRTFEGRVEKTMRGQVPPSAFSAFGVVPEGVFACTHACRQRERHKTSDREQGASADTTYDLRVGLWICEIQSWDVSVPNVGMVRTRP